MAEFDEKSDESEVSDFELSEDFTNCDLVQLNEMKEDIWRDNGMLL